MLKLRACSTLQETLGETPSDLRARLKALTGHSFRRINRYIELALLGACRVSAETGGIGGDAALYLTSTAPMLTDSIRLLQAVIRDRRPPSPFEFMNVSGNMAGFYIGQHLGLAGPQLALQRPQAPFAAALEMMTLQSGRHRRALLGYVEEGIWPLEEQRRRLPVGSAERPLSECSHWFYIDQDCETPLATIEYRTLDDHSALQCLLDELRHEGAPLFAAGPDEAVLAGLQLPHYVVDDDDGSYSSGRTALAIGRFVQQHGPAASLLHLEPGDGAALHAILVRPPRSG